MTSAFKQQLLIKQLHEVSNCFEQPSVTHGERVQNVTQLKACIATVEAICNDFRSRQESSGQGGDGAELLRQKLDETAAALEVERARADAAEASSSAGKRGSGSSGEVRQLTARIAELEAELAERTDQLEAGAAKLHHASAAPLANKGDASKGDAAMAHRVSTLTREVEERTRELEALKAHASETQKQLWDSREALQALKHSRDAEVEKHHREMEKLRNEMADLLPGNRVRTSSATGELKPFDIIDDLPGESIEAMSPEALHYRRQLTGERQEHARLRKERNEARSRLEHRTEELRRNQVRALHPPQS